MALASGIDTSIKLFLMTAIYTEKQNGRRFQAREHRLGFGDARELKNFGEHSPTPKCYNLSTIPTPGAHFLSHFLAMWALEYEK